MIRADGFVRSASVQDESGQSQFAPLKLRSLALPPESWQKIQFVGNSDKLPQTAEAVREALVGVELGGNAGGISARWARSQP